MLERLELRNLGLIAEADVELNPGLVVVTGETGAGKTMLFDAVLTLAGGKPGLVREDSDAEVHGWLRLSQPAAAERIDELGAALDDGVLQVDRLFPAAGRAKALMGGRPVPAPTLTELAALWLAVHGQHDSQRLLKSSTHRQLLDRFGGAVLAEHLEAQRLAFGHWAQAVTALAAAEAQQAELLHTAEALRADLALCESLNLRPGEMAEIEQRIERLGRADQVVAAVEQIQEQLVQAEDGAASRLAAAERALSQALPSDSEGRELADRLRAARLEVQELAAEVGRISADLEADPVELDALMLRQRQLRSILLRRGPEIEDVLDWMAVARAQLALVDPKSPELKRRQQAVVESRQQLEATATALTAARTEAAGRLNALVTAELRELAMPHAQFEVGLFPQEIAELGADRVEFRFSANPGLPLSPIAQAASGGELSRLMLALEVVLVTGPAAETDPGTLLFDEVDAGVAGAAAIAVAERLSRLAAYRQVMVVTHLPQIAAFADQHLVVTKSSDGTVTSTEIADLGTGERTAEIARLLAGLGDSASALAHAAELLEHATSMKARMT